MRRLITQYAYVLAMGIVVLAIMPSVAIAQLADGHDKFLGCILKGHGDNGMTSDPDFLTYWNQVTPENAGKHGLFEDPRDTYETQAMDEIYNFAQNNNLPLKEHTFLFWCCGADPDWLSSLSASAIRAELEEWIIDYFNMYPNVDYVEVVNEPFQSPPPSSIRNALGGDTDYQWVRWMFDKAREHAPSGTELWINENNILKGGGRINNYKDLIGFLKADGTVDGVGMQGHWLENTSASTIQNSLDQMDDVNLPLYITEYEVSESNDNTQKNIWEDQFPVFWEHPAVEGVTLWGYKEGQIWRNNGYLLRSDGTERPALQWLRDYLDGGSSSGTTVTVRAKMLSGSSDQLELKLDGNTVKTWTVSGSNYSTYTHEIDGSHNVKLYFQDNGTDMQVDYMDVGNTRYEVEDQATNTAAWENGSCGGSYKEKLFCRGHVDFGTIDASSSEATVTVRAKMLSGSSDNLELRLDGSTVKTWTVSGSSYSNYTHTIDGSHNVKLYFQDNGTDMEIDYMDVGSTRYQAEDQATNTSTWQNGSCGGSYSQKMYCPGHIDFGTIDASNARVAQNITDRMQDEELTSDKLFKVYPNPTQIGNLKFELVSKSSNQARMSLMNVSGQEAKSRVVHLQQGMNQFDWDISGLQKGMYILTINMQGENHTQKLIVN